MVIQKKSLSIYKKRSKYKLAAISIGKENRNPVARVESSNVSIMWLQNQKRALDQAIVERACQCNFKASLRGSS